MERPYVLLSCAMSIDGYIDDAGEQRLILSDQADLDRVDELRAGCDAILVGAGTIRADNPRLVLRSQARRAARVARGIPPDPAKVTITGTGDLDPSARFFTAGEGDKVVYVASRALDRTGQRLGLVADVRNGGDPVDLGRVLADLAALGVARLLVEGGGSVHTAFLVTGLADELQLAIVPFLVGDSRAPRFVGDGRFPWHARHPARLADVTSIGNVAVLRYALSGRYPR